MDNMKYYNMQVDMDVLKDTSFTIYEDGDIVILNNVKDISQADIVNVQVNIYMLVCCIEGSVTTDIGSKHYVANKNDVLLCTPNIIISDMHFSSDYLGVVLCVSTRLVLENLSYKRMWEKTFLLHENLVFHFSESSGRLLFMYGNLIRMRLDYPDRPYRKEVISSIFFAVIYELMAEIDSLPNMPDRSVLTRGEMLFEKFLSLLAKQKVKPRRIAWYSNKLCITPKYLSAICKDVSGRTANEWINMFVVADIRRLLKLSDMSIKEISDYLEFPNLSFFGKYVKTHLGASPKAYRRKVRNGKD